MSLLFCQAGFRLVRFRLAAATALLAGLVACGEVTVDDGDFGSGSDAALDSSADAVGPGDAATAETVGVDTAGLTCANDLDCSGIKGKTPCKLPKCDNGQCKLVPRKENEPCQNPGDVLGECQQSTCTIDGQCTTKSKKDGTLCGLGKCGHKCDAGTCLPATAADYEDGNPCTLDFCDQGNAVVHKSITDLSVTCNDGDACTSDDACVGGQCQGQPLQCTDGLACSFDACDKVKGCVFTPNHTKCDDGNPCSIDACDLAEGCTVTGHKAGLCDDGDKCTTNDLCAACKPGEIGCAGGKCEGKGGCGCTGDADCVQYSTPCGGKSKCNLTTKLCAVDPTTIVQCEQTPGATCVKNACDAATGQCKPGPINDGKECDDGDACTPSSACAKGACVGAGAKACNDDNPCTTDACDPSKGCVFEPNGDPCDDNDKCTTADACQSGGCTGKKQSCDDETFCTFDSCDATTGTCVHTADAKLCEDGNPCTTDTCSPATKSCGYASNDAGKCSDGNDCTTDTCTGGKCQSVNTCECKADADCNDGNPCTKDSCSAGKCKYDAVAATGSACSTADKCQQPGSGVCEAGTCKSGNKPVVCSGDACTTATCNPATGKCEAVSKGDGTPCDADQSGCTVNDACKAGKCVAGPAPSKCALTDSPCLVGTCVPKAGSSVDFTCGTTPAASTVSCDDGKYCTDADHCNGQGACVGSPKVCGGTSGPGGPTGGFVQPCHDSVCDEVAKTCTVKPSAQGSKCDDGKFCTQADSCDGQGQCVGGAPVVCKSGTCFQGVCDEGTQSCFAVPAPNCCSVSADCDDGKPCTTDACQNGKCTAAQLIGCCNTVAWANHFDDGKARGLMFTNSAGPTQGWQVRADSPKFASPKGVLYYGSVGKNNFNFGTSEGSATSAALVLPQHPEVKMTFWLFLDTEGGDFYDKLIVSVLKPATGEKIEVWKKKGDTPINQPIPVSVPLANFGGQSVQIEFKFQTGDAIGNEGQGVFIDDLQITAPCPTTPKG